MFHAQRRNRERKCTQGGASLCPGLSHFATLGRGHHNPIVRGLSPVSCHRVEQSWPTRDSGAATTYSLLSPKISNASSSYECHGLRGARPSARGCSFGSSPNRCHPNVARAFQKVSEAHRNDSAPRSLARRGALSARATAQAGATALCF
jgi:hypothetical protein